MVVREKNSDASRHKTRATNQSSEASTPQSGSARARSQSAGRSASLSAFAANRKSRLPAWLLSGSRCVTHYRRHSLTPHQGVGDGRPHRCWSRRQIRLSLAASWSSRLPGRRFDRARAGFLPRQLTDPKEISTNLLNPSSRCSNQFDSCRNVEPMTFRTGSRQMKNLEGKVALVTGASKGIGAAIARELAARGAAVAVNYSGSKAGADKVVAEIQAAGGKAVAFQADLSNPDSVGPFVKSVAEQLGPIDILVNNAGIYEFGALEQITPEHFHKQFNLNVLGLLLTTQPA